MVQTGAQTIWFLLRKCLKIPLGQRYTFFTCPLSSTNSLLLFILLRLWTCFLNHKQRDFGQMPKQTQLFSQVVTWNNGFFPPKALTIKRLFQLSISLSSVSSQHKHSWKGWIISPLREGLFTHIWSKHRETLLGRWQHLLTRIYSDCKKHYIGLTELARILLD